MGEPARDVANGDDIEALGGEREMLEPIWSELDFISNGDLKDIFVSSDIGLGKVDSGIVKSVEDGTNAADGLGREQIGADFWKLKEAKDQDPQHQRNMAGFLKVREEPSELLSVQGILMEKAVSLKTGFVRVKEDPVFSEEVQQEKIVPRVSVVKEGEVTYQAKWGEGIGARIFRAKDEKEEGTAHEGWKAMNATRALEDAKTSEVEQLVEAMVVDGGNVDFSEQGTEDTGTEDKLHNGSVADEGNVDVLRQDAEEAGTDDSPSNGSRAEESTPSVSHEIQLPVPVYEVHTAELGGVMKDGSLSTEGLAKVGMVLTDDSSEEESEYSEEEVDSDSDGSSSDEPSSSSEEEDIKIIKEKIRKSSEETKEDSEPPRTKHELSVLPPVPKVEAVLEPHHHCEPTGLVSSVVDLTIVVEGNDGSRVLSDGSILWLTESRVPLGIVDEVFGPVKKPYYLVRFNEVSEIHESAKVGASVSYVGEFAEFVLKDNPSLYKKAIDASGLDDEELSDAEIEFSDDEKEMAAKQRERGKRGHDSKENGVGQGRDSSDTQPPDARGRWQRRENGRGRGPSRGAGPHMTEGIDSAVMSVADMDLHGLRFNSASFGSKNHRGMARSRPAAGRFQISSRPSYSGGWDGHDLVATNSRLHDGLSRGDWATSPTRHSPGAGSSVNGSQHQVPLMRRDERRDGPWYPEQADLVDRQAHQAISMQEHCSFGVAPIHRHLPGPGAEPRQLVGSGFSAFNYNSVPGPQIATDGQGNFFHITGPVNMPPDVGNVGRSNVHGMGMNLGPTMVSVLPQTSPNSYSMYNNQVQGTLNARQRGYDPVFQADANHRGQHGGYMGPASGYSSRMPAPDFRFQALSPASQNAGPGGVAGPQGSGYDHGSAPHGHRNRYQGSRTR